MSSLSRHMNEDLNLQVTGTNLATRPDNTHSELLQKRNMSRGSSKKRLVIDCSPEPASRTATKIINQKIANVKVISGKAPNRTSPSRQESKSSAVKIVPNAMHIHNHTNSSVQMNSVV